MSLLDHLDDYGSWIVALTSGLAALGWLARALRRRWRAARARWTAWAAKVHAAAQLVELEMRHNHGSSVKDSLSRIETKVTRLDKTIRANSHRLDQLERHAATSAEAQAHVWPAIEAVAKAEPPAG